MLNEATEDIITKTAINDINKKLEFLATDLKSLKNRLHESVSRTYFSKQVIVNIFRIFIFRK